MSRSTRACKQPKVEPAETRLSRRSSRSTRRARCGAGKSARYTTSSRGWAFSVPLARRIMYLMYRLIAAVLVLATALAACHESLLATATTPCSRRVFVKTSFRHSAANGSCNGRLNRASFSRPIEAGKRWESQDGRMSGSLLSYASITSPCSAHSWLNRPPERRVGGRVSSLPYRATPSAPVAGMP